MENPNGYHIFKDGWRIWITEGRAHWVEAYPTYSEQCKTCHGTGSVQATNCACDDEWGPSMGFGCSCTQSCGCRMIHGVGMARDKPKFPMPSLDIITAVESALSKTLKEFGKAFDAGIIEAEIAEHKATEAALKSAGL
jgi:hypothetical protein